MTCSSTFSSVEPMREALQEGASLQGASTTRSTRRLSAFSAPYVGKSTLARQWLGMVAAQHLGEQSKLAAIGALPHHSTATRQEASASR